jgi:branched-chain amino acid transport system permease protein
MMLRKYKQGIFQIGMIFFIGLLMLSPIICFILYGFQFIFNHERFIGLCLILAIIASASLIVQRKIIFKYLNKIASRLNFNINVTSTKTHPYWLSLFGLAMLLMPLMLSKYWLSVSILVLIYVLLGLGLDIVVGLAGLLNLGFAAFYAIGAYTYALSAEYLHLGFWTALPLAALVCALFGAILGFPVLRMVGDYLAIVTLGFGEIVRLILNNWSNFTHGPNGLSVPNPTLFGIEFTRSASQGGITFHSLFNISYNSSYRTTFIYWVLLLIVFVVLFFIIRLKTMPQGRAWEALREDEIACRSLGINHVTSKLSAFSLGALIGGVGGVFFAASQGFVSPASFTFVESALILSIVVLGGMGSTLGVVLAATILTLLPEVLRDFSQYRMLVFGILMVSMMIWRPKGLIRINRPFIPVPNKRS